MPQITLYQYKDGEMHTHESPYSEHRGCVRVGEFVPASDNTPEKLAHMRLEISNVVDQVNHGNWSWLDAAGKLNRVVKELDVLASAPPDTGEGLAAETLESVNELADSIGVVSIVNHAEQGWVIRLFSGSEPGAWVKDKKLVNAMIEAKAMLGLDAAINSLAATHKDNPTTGGAE